MITVVFIAIIIILLIVNNEKMRWYNFDALIQNVSYNVKGDPTITINGTEYFLSYSHWQFGIAKIEKGDRIIKIKGKMDLKLIKKNRRDTINFFHQY